MIFGSLNEVFENDKTIYDAVKSHNQRMLNEDYSPKQNSTISNILKLMSRRGMDYEKLIQRNMRAVPANPDMLRDGDKNLYSLMSSMYGTQALNWRVKGEEEKAFRDKSMDDKRQILRRMAEQPEIEDILDIMCNECIVYDSDNNYICKPFIDNAVLQDLNERSLNEVRTAIDSIFYKIYMLENMKEDAWNKFRRFLIDGVIAFHIIYDDLQHPKNIIDIVEVDPATLTKVIEGTMTYWIQYKGVMGHERKLLDAEIIYIKYTDDGVSTRQSYLERLMRPFNIYRIIEQAQIIWTVTQSSFKTKFTIPVGDQNRAKGAQTLNSAMNRYKEDIAFNNDTGELKVNGRVNLPFNKEYWFPSNSIGTPEVETLVDNGPQLNDSDQLKFFLSKLYKMSKIPESRFDKESGTTWFGTDASAVLRDEINFGRFVQRLRHIFSYILIKPLQIQLALQIPDLKNDKRILDSISLYFYSYNQFQELMEAEVDMKRMEHIQTLKDTFISTDADGNEVPYFCDKFLLIKYLKMSDADIELNEKYKKEQQAEQKRVEAANDDDTLIDEPENEPENGPENEPNDSSEDEDGELDIDKEMMGDVQPESEETTEA